MVSPDTFDEANRAGAEVLRTSPTVRAAFYDPLRDRLCLVLSDGLEVTIPRARIEGLSDAAPDALRSVEITPAGLGLHFPDADADLYVPALLAGIFGSRAWMLRRENADRDAA